MNELLKKSVKELKELEEKARAELFALRFQAAMGNLERPHRIKELRKEIARILTVLSMHRLAGEATNVSVKVDLSETYSKIEKESQEFVKKQRAKAEEMMNAQSGQGNDLMDLPLPIDQTDLTAEQETNSEPVAEQKASAKTKTTKSSQTTKAKSAATEKKSTSKAATSTEKLSVKPAAKKGKIADIEIAEAKKDPDAKEFTYGSNWKENKQRIEEATAKDKPKTTTSKQSTKKGADK